MEFLLFYKFLLFWDNKISKQKVSLWKSQNYTLFCREISKVDILFGSKLQKIPKPDTRFGKKVPKSTPWSGARLRVLYVWKYPLPPPRS